ncbi:PaaI family thioesterase [Larsenimonas suaedae]|uniref:PaaI family thioesterase n=1 Tax=Larsenimonas suaedae TaxID=1851019 RepID=A0ABU1GXD8_9GAMM|nr:PaaI family thioesterase [Larsenimonas suaedae]MCM2971459.1 PaaI family thioesterase [Larsenimonas suaedae]MDR5896715.1 PaaI family thioesterase [Larsenimonas suaedae]
MSDTSSLDWLEQSRAINAPDTILDNMPYARWLGIEVTRDDSGLVFMLPARRDMIGNPLLPAIHGGAMGAFMETAAIIDTMLALRTAKMPKIANFSIDYLRAGKCQPTYARCELVREGKRLANLRVHAWQASEDRLVATARLHCVLAELDQTSIR